MTAEVSRVTRDGMISRIKELEFRRFGETTTFCSLTLDNGYSVHGQSACVDPRAFDEGVGKDLAFEDAIRKLWPLFGFLLAEDRFRG